MKFIKESITNYKKNTKELKKNQLNLKQKYNH